MAMLFRFQLASVLTRFCTFVSTQASSPLREPRIHLRRRGRGAPCLPELGPPAWSDRGRGPLILEKSTYLNMFLV